VSVSKAKSCCFAAVYMYYCYWLLLRVIVVQSRKVPIVAWPGGREDVSKPIGTR
jgi:hypothetical protein